MKVSSHGAGPPLNPQEDQVMKTNLHAWNRRWLLTVLAASLLAVVSWGYAQDRRERPESESPAQAPREREDRRGGEEPGDRTGTPEGLPQTRIAPPGDSRPYILPARRWMLGVHAYNTESGVVVTRVLPGSGASEAGLEPRDVIVTVDGFQVGYVGGQLYALGDELQHRAGSRGRVRLLVQNWRDNQLVNLDATLRRDDVHYPAPRER
jgi:hypothetical protein